MDSEFKKGPKKIQISSSSLVALKAELLHKQSQVQRVKTDGIKTIRNRPKNKKAAEKQNSGVESRAKRDEEQEKEDQPSLDKSRVMLEEKAKLYERLSRDKTLLDEDTISEDQSVFLVNFQQKVVENTVKERQKQKLCAAKADIESSSSDEGREEDYATTNPEEQWVDYVDSFGRTRRCLKKDLPVFQQQDAELNKQPSDVSSTSVSYGNFVISAEPNPNEESQNNLGLDEEARKRQRQLWEEEEEKNRQKNKVHYQDILYQEARQHGVGFYSFSKDEEERAKQMEELEGIRKQTEAARAQIAQTSTDKQSALEARLKKVRDRKRQKMGLPPLKEQPKPLPTPAVAPETPPTTTDIVKEAEDNLRQAVARGLPQSAKVRPWDFGKEGVPKKPVVMTQDTWVDKKREERRQEFAPPAAYKESETSRSRKFAKHQEPMADANPVISEDSIISGLAFMKQMQFPNPGIQPTPIRKYEEDVAAEEEEENDDDLMPPGETDEPQPGEITTSNRWRSMPSRRGAEIAPPPSMDYYNNGSSSNARRGVPSQRTNVSQSFSVGISQRENVASDNHPSEAKEAARSKWDFSQ